MKRIVGGLVPVALMAFAAPALAVPFTYTFDFGGSSPVQATGGATSGGVSNVGGTINMTDSDGGAPLKTHISAYSKNGTGNANGNVYKAALGNYTGISGAPGGLGVTNNLTPVESGSPDHTVDNRDHTDFVVFQFNDKVQLTGALLDLFADPSTKDGDVTIGYLINETFSETNGYGPFINGEDFSDIGFTTFQSPAGSSDPRDANFSALTTGVYANTWIIMADLLRGSGTPNDGNYDDFKISNITVKTKAPPPPNGAVPEPATWAMMISGFGLIGSSMRRNRPKLTTA